MGPGQTDNGGHGRDGRDIIHTASIATHPFGFPSTPHAQATGGGLDGVAPIRYARNGDVRLAYQIYGTGTIDMLAIPPFAQNIELMWERRSTPRCSTGSDNSPGSCTSTSGAPGCPTAAQQFRPSTSRSGRAGRGDALRRPGLSGRSVPEERDGAGRARLRRRQPDSHRDRWRSPPSTTSSCLSARRRASSAASPSSFSPARGSRTPPAPASCGRYFLSSERLNRVSFLLDRVNHRATSIAVS